MSVNLHQRMRSFPRTDNCRYRWENVVKMIDRSNPDAVYEHIEMNPPYQRPIVWTEAQQSAFVGHLLDGGECPKIYIQQWRNVHNIPSEIIDGKQRLTSIYRWMKGEIFATCNDGTKIWYADTDIVDRRSLWLELYMVDLPIADRLTFYLRLNRGGTIHTSDEIAKVEKMLSEVK